MGQLQEVINAIVKTQHPVKNCGPVALETCRLTKLKMVISVGVSNAVVFSQKLTHRTGLIFLNICLLLFKKKCISYSLLIISKTKAHFMNEETKAKKRGGFTPGDIDLQN